MIKGILVLLLLIILMFGGLLSINNDSGQKDVFHDTYTRALCSGQMCRDFLVTCSGNEAVSLEPISGFVTFSSEWVDTREERELC